MRALFLCGLLLLAAKPLRAQDAGSVGLDRVIEYIDAAHFDSARSALQRWHATRAPSALPAERAAAASLTARLERDGAAAREAWLALALAHPFSPDAGLALLRVGQAAVLAGDTLTARVYLTRLHDDFPGSGHGAEAYLWLSRTHQLARRGASACDAARAGLAEGGSAEVLGLLRLQQERACIAGAADPTPPAPVTVTPGGRFAVQSGAFRARAGADALMARLRQAGLQPRLVRVPGNDLMRVRVGAFEEQADAVAARDRLRSEGFDAVLVDDATRETPVP